MRMGTCTRRGTRLKSQIDTLHSVGRIALAGVSMINNHSQEGKAKIRLSWARFLKIKTKENEENAHLSGIHACPSGSKTCAYQDEALLLRS